MSVVSREQFVEIIDILKGIDRYHEELNTFLSKHGAEGCVYQPDNKVAIMMVLKAMFDDDDNLISWFCCESDYGKMGAEDMVKDDDGNPVNLSTPEKLYDFLMRG